MSTAMTAHAPARPLARTEHLFYVTAGTLMLILTTVGFRLFILHGKGFGGGEITSQILPLVVAHGLAMFSWVTLFLVQSLLILNGNRRLQYAPRPRRRRARGRYHRAGIDRGYFVRSL